MSCKISPSHQNGQHQQQQDQRQKFLQQYSQVILSLAIAIFNTTTQLRERITTNPKSPLYRKSTNISKTPSNNSRSKKPQTTNPKTDSSDNKSTETPTKKTGERNGSSGCCDTPSKSSSDDALSSSPINLYRTDILLSKRLQNQIQELINSKDYYHSYDNHSLKNNNSDTTNFHNTPKSKETASPSSEPYNIPSNLTAKIFSRVVQDYINNILVNLGMDDLVDIRHIDVNFSNTQSNNSGINDTEIKRQLKGDDKDCEFIKKLKSSWLSDPSQCLKAPRYLYTTTASVPETEETDGANDNTSQSSKFKDSTLFNVMDLFKKTTKMVEIDFTELLVKSLKSTRSDLRSEVLDRIRKLESRLKNVDVEGNSSTSGQILPIEMVYRSLVNWVQDFALDTSATTTTTPETTTTATGPNGENGLTTAVNSDIKVKTISGDGIKSYINENGKIDFKERGIDIDLICKVLESCNLVDPVRQDLKKTLNMEKKTLELYEKVLKYRLCAVVVKEGRKGIKPDSDIEIEPLRAYYCTVEGGSSGVGDVTNEDQAIQKWHASINKDIREIEMSALAAKKAEVTGLLWIRSDLTENYKEECQSKVGEKRKGDFGAQKDSNKAPQNKQEDTLGDLERQYLMETIRNSLGEEAMDFIGENGEVEELIYCRLCNQDYEDEQNKIFVCDKCEAGVHQLCETPTIPSSDIALDPWFCTNCDPVKKKQQQRYIKRTKTQKNGSDSNGKGSKKSRKS
ncbi:mitochondrial transcription factor 2 [Mycoemilia scoparia]|uniref:Mitochondrial transcription factor 2 n=1 Tax=Mycoemilia scoparia TaxID=417184 RepID=A0A9W8DSC3_9FUNG|nr:mitochondrial transcription factor 2 [Mycoemilia scoparia]